MRLASRWALAGVAVVAVAAPAAHAKGDRPGYGTVMLCGQQSGRSAFVKAPRDCIFVLDRDYDNLHGANTLPVQNIRWRRWGQRTAIGVGTWPGRGEPRRARIRLTGRTKCHATNPDRASAAYTRYRVSVTGLERTVLAAPKPGRC